MQFLISGAEMALICNRCGSVLNRYNPGTLCFPCQEKKMEAIANEEKRYYDASDMMDILGLKSEEHVRRKARDGLIPGRIPGIRRHLFLKEVIDDWIRSGGIVQRKPTSPLQEEAYALCRRGDHSWLDDARFDGIAYRSEDVSDLVGSLVTIKQKRTCYFCGHVEVVSF